MKHVSLLAVVVILLLAACGGPASQADPDNSSFRLTVVIAGPGTVTLAVDGQDGALDPDHDAGQGVFVAAVRGGAAVELTAAGDEETVVTWHGGCEGAAGTSCTFAMTGHSRVEVTFTDGSDGAPGDGDGPADPGDLPVDPADPSDPVDPGDPDDPDDPDDGSAAPFAIASLEPPAAPRGEQFDVLGSGFGSARGTVLIDGLPATVSSWQDGMITVTVPAGAKDGPVVLRVTTPAGSRSADAFVGAYYAGPGEGLPDFAAGLLPGTHLLLAGIEFTLRDDQELRLAGVSMWGSGLGLTRLNVRGALIMEPAPGAVDLLLTRLSLATDVLAIREAGAAAAASGHVLSQEDAVVRLRDLSISELGFSGSGARLLDYVVPSRHLSLEIANVEVTGATAALGFRTGGRISVAGLEARVDSLFLLAGAGGAGSLAVTDSLVNATSSVVLSGGGGMAISGTSAHAEDGSVLLAGAVDRCLTGSGPVVPTGSLTVTDSSLGAAGEWAAGSAPGDRRGEVLLCTAGAGMVMKDSSVSATGQLVIRIGGGGLDVRGSGFHLASAVAVLSVTADGTGAPDTVAVLNGNRIEGSVPQTYRPRHSIVMTYGTCELSGNEVDMHLPEDEDALEISCIPQVGAPTDSAFRLSGNAFSLGGNETTVFHLAAETAALDIKGNSFDAAGMMLVRVGNDTAARIESNVFDLGERFEVRAYPRDYAGPVAFVNNQVEFRPRASGGSGLSFQGLRHVVVQRNVVRGDPSVTEALYVRGARNGPLTTDLLSLSVTSNTFQGFYGALMFAGNVGDDEQLTIYSVVSFRDNCFGFTARAPYQHAVRLVNTLGIHIDARQNYWDGLAGSRLEELVLRQGQVDGKLEQSIDFSEALMDASRVCATGDSY